MLNFFVPLISTLTLINRVKWSSVGFCCSKTYWKNFNRRLCRYRLKYRYENSSCWEKSEEFGGLVLWNYYVVWHFIHEPVVWDRRNVGTKERFWLKHICTYFSLLCCAVARCVICWVSFFDPFVRPIYRFFFLGILSW